MKNLYQVIKKPVITEKSTGQVADGKYTFEVDKRAAKNEVKQAVEKVFGVVVLDVQTANVKGKTALTGRRRTLGKKPDRKKVTVTLKEGDKIELFEAGG